MNPTTRNAKEQLDAIGGLRRSHGLMRTIAAIVSLAFAMLILAPTAMAARAEIERAQAAEAGNSTQSAEAQFAKTLENTEDRLARLIERLGRQENPAAEQAAIKNLRKEVKRLDAKIIDNFNRL